MKLLDQTVFVLRIVQITIAFIAGFIAIATCPAQGNNSTQNGYLMMASIICCFETAALGCIGLIALLRPQDLAWYLALLFDFLALGATIAAAVCINVKARFWRLEVALRITIIFAYICIGPIVISIFRTIYVWGCAERQGRIQLKEHSDIWTPEDIRRLEKRIEQLETESTTRPFSPSETMARWSAISGNDTLSQFQSEKDM